MTEHLLQAEVPASAAGLRFDQILPEMFQGYSRAHLAGEVKAGRIRLALDVTDPEPLPEDHPLWDAPETIIAPHLGGLSDAKIPRERRLRRRQAEHLLAGEEPENVVIQ